MSVAPPPSIAVTLAINPSNFTLGSHVELSVTAVSNASYPITVDTWPNIFNPGLSQQRGSLVGVDKDTHKELEMHVIDFRMNAEPLNDRTLGGVHDEYLVTLEPGQTRAFNTFFYTAVGDRYHKPDVLPGHRYLIDLEESEQVGWWKKGRKEDVLDLPGQDRGAGHADGKPITLSLDAPVEFKVLPLEQMTLDLGGLWRGSQRNRRHALIGGGWRNCRDIESLK